MREIVYEPIDKILNALENPKRHDLKAVQQSIERFGYAAPAIIDERTGRLVVGHGRIEALKALRDSGAPPPEGVRRDDDGTWLVPILRGWSSKTDQEASAYLIADNRDTELGGWDNEKLAQLLDDIGDPNLVDITGVDLNALAELLDTDDDPTTDDDDSPRPTNYGVTVHCDTMADQARLMERLTGWGYEAKPHSL